MGKKISIFIGVLLLAGVISYFLIDANEKAFDQTQWQTSPSTRYEMATALVESKLLFGKTKTEVVALLGTAKPSTLEGKDHLVYALRKPPSFFDVKDETLIVIFENEKVVNVVHNYE
ncbi:hypothetical protein [Lacinutrix chionoecetis]